MDDRTARAVRDVSTSPGAEVRDTENQLYSPPLLKLHGSMNWFIHTGHSILEGHPSFDEKSKQEKIGKTVLCKGNWWGYMPHMMADGWYLYPLMITPVLHINVDRPIFNELWSMARGLLATCKTLIVGGYSFPPTDFHTKRLFLEAFADHTPDEVVVIDPNIEIVKALQRLFHYKGTVIYFSDLAEFVKQYLKK